MIKFLRKGFTGVDLQTMNLKEVGLIYLSRISLLSFIPLTLLITALICKYVVFG